MSAMRRRDVPLLLVVLPDGSRSLIPVSWTDSAATSIADEPAAMSNNHRKIRIGIQQFVDALAPIELAPGSDFTTKR
jgi:hypothetical protein